MARDRLINIRCTDEETVMLHSAAASAGLTLSDWARLALLAAAGQGDLARQLERSRSVMSQLAVINAWTYAEQSPGFVPPLRNTRPFMVLRGPVSGDGRIVAQVLEFPSGRALNEGDVAERPHLGHHDGKTRVLIHGDTQPYRITCSFFDAMTKGFFLAIERIPEAA